MEMERPNWGDPKGRVSFKVKPHDEPWNTRNDEELNFYLTAKQAKLLGRYLRDENVTSAEVEP